ncbi:MAG: 4Fe-4S dicluster domain-containing protein [Coriobacteriales bacterium]|jgi:Fe-S-cluster-containing dehydrogenase component
MDKAFLIDLNHCSGCHNCQIACKDEHCDQDWLPYAAAQPTTGQFWCKVYERERGQVPVVRVAYRPTMCAHCADAPCEAVCPAGAFKRRDDGLLLIDPQVCTGCGACAEACPIGAIFMNGETHIAQKCTGCAHLLDDGWTVPRCVDACCTDALLFGEEDELDLEGAEPLEEIAGYGPKVYYKGLPKRFAAGCVYDPEVNDAVIGAEVTLADSTGSVLARQESDFMGDWIFEQIEPGSYTVSIEADGYEPIEFDVDVTEKDMFTGNKPLAKKLNL